jgi:hypothetical protein
VIFDVIIKTQGGVTTMTTKKIEKTEKVTRKQSKARIPREKTLAQIAKEQGVRPFDPSENGKNWPEGADFQEFIDAIHSGRNNGK